MSLTRQRERNRWITSLSGKLVIGRTWREISQHSSDRIGTISRRHHCPSGRTLMCRRLREKRVVAGHAALHRNKLSEAIALCHRKPFQIGPSICFADRRSQSHEDHLMQILIASSIDSGVCNFFKVRVNNSSSSVVHRVAPSSTTESVQNVTIDEGVDVAMIAPSPRTTCNFPCAQRRRPRGTFRWLPFRLPNLRHVSTSMP
jgi:hypothetical protein